MAFWGNQMAFVFKLEEGSQSFKQKEEMHEYPTVEIKYMNNNVVKSIE